MPSEYGDGSLPEPIDPSVTLRTVPPQTVAVLAFSGLVSDADVAKKEAELRAKLAADAEYEVAAGASVEVLQVRSGCSVWRS